MDLSELNPAQRAAVAAGDGPHLVIAGAGTGKTRTLVHRVAWLIEHGVPPAGIVLLTFTRRAAREMLDRVARLVGSQAHGVRGGTFHSFAVRALRRYGDAVGLTPAFTILDRADAESLVGLVRTELGLGGRQRRFARRGTILNVLSRAVNTSRSIADALEAVAPQYASDLADFERIAARYTERKREQGVVDFDDLLVLLAQLLTASPDARRRLASAARHVLVDEYQDTNKLQARIAALLSSVHGNLMVVGDEAQAIYAFRGADVDNILGFPELFEGCAVTKLEQNYRSTQPVLTLANGVLEASAHGFAKHLVSVRGDGPVPVLLEVADEHEQADAVVGELLARREDGVDLERQAVLFRASHHSFLLEAALGEAGIPFRKYGGMRFTEAAHVKDVFALLRLVANPRDVLAWFRVLGWFEGVGTKTAQRIGDAILGAEPPRLDPSRYGRARYHADLVGLARFAEEATEAANDVEALVEAAVAWYRPYGPSIYDDWKKRQRDLDALGLLAERHDTLEGLLADVALDPVQDAEPQAVDDDEVLTLSTVHSAKGLEWDAVTVLNLGDGAFPSGFSLDDPDELEEERRLLYVAVTRARRWLTLVEPRFLRVRRGPVIGPGCTLLDQIPDLAGRVEMRRPGRAPAHGDLPVEDTDEVARIARILGWFDR